MNRRVLLVDDQPDFQEGVRQLLAPHFDLTLASSGVEALVKCEKRGPFAVVVSDYGMPGMTGIEFLSELRTLCPETVRIMLTGCIDLGLALEALDRGEIFRFLTKPPNAARLVESVTAGVERFRQSEAERLLTEQLFFVRESLQALNGALESRLADALEHTQSLEHWLDGLSNGSSPEGVIAGATEAVRRLLGTRSADVVVKDSGLEIVPSRSVSPKEQRSLALLAGSARVALEHAQHDIAVQRAKQATLVALQQLAQHRDDETSDHLVRVSAYCRLLARALRSQPRYADVIDDVFIEDIARAAPLHDIGKVAIPDSILFKPGKLDPAEWEIMRTHAAVGAEILRRALEAGEEQGSLHLAHEIAWTHHERWDGKGYPRGLAGEAIPLAGRIMALADCYDALTSERPYKKAWSHEDAVIYLREQRGLAFDPLLTDVFLAHAEELVSIPRTLGLAS